MDIFKIKRWLEEGVQTTEEHVGLRNVHLRAKINGDSSCGVSVAAVLPHGTQVSIRLIAWKEVPEL